MQNSVHYESGNNNEIAVVLSCPGQEEESANPQGPAKGQTGRNLEKILELLTNDYGRIGYVRGQISITNSWDQVEYPDKTDRSEATINEILDGKNLDRLASELGCIESTIICCGINATAAVLALSYAGKIKSRAKVVFLNHLGNQSLNSSIKQALDGSEIKSYSKAEDKPANETRSLEQIRKDNRILRLNVVAKELNKQISAA